MSPSLRFPLLDGESDDSFSPEQPAQVGHRLNARSENWVRFVESARDRPYLNVRSENWVCFVESLVLRPAGI